MSKQPAISDSPHASLVYQIRLGGHLNRHWANWLEGLTITLEAGGTTLLTCAVADQAALHGLLKRVRDLNMTLLSVVSVAGVQGQRVAVKRE